MHQSRGKQAEYAIDALALQASDAALLAIDAFTIRYRTKFKNIGQRAKNAFAKAAQSRGLSEAELGDRVVPWLGFEAGTRRVIECGAVCLEVFVGLDWALHYHDPATKKRLSSLRGRASAEIKAEMKVLAAALKEAVKIQLLRLEHLMVQQHRWPVDRWRELFLQHPVLVPFAVRLVWGAYNQNRVLASTFRASSDRSLIDAEEESMDIPVTAVVGIVHPLDLEATVRELWREHLEEHDLAPPFAQLDRPVLPPTADQSPRKFLIEFKGAEVNAMTFRGRAEKRGWGPVMAGDGGIITSYYKPFAVAGVDVFIALEDMFVGPDADSSVTLQRFFFVRHGSVETGSYAYDEPDNEADPRVIPAGQVPPIAFSEALADLHHISDKQIEESE